MIVNAGGLIILLLFIKTRDEKITFGLFLFELIDLILGLLRQLGIRINLGKFLELFDGSLGNFLVVLRFSRPLGINEGNLIPGRFHPFAIGIIINNFFKFVPRLLIEPLSLKIQSDFVLGRGGVFAVRGIFNNRTEDVDDAVFISHEGADELILLLLPLHEPFANTVLPLHNLRGTVTEGVFFDNFLVGLVGFIKPSLVFENHAEVKLGIGSLLGA